jgi:two-component system nitrate/nitrite response regulator NarL
MTTANIRLLLVDDHRLVRDGLAAILEDETDITLVGMASNGQEAIEAAQALQPDIILMDIDMPILSGIAATQLLTQHYPQIKVLMLTMHNEDDYIMQVMQSGAVGYVQKNIEAELLIKTLRSVSQGILAFPPLKFATPSLAPEVTKATAASKTVLTKREQSIAVLKAQGHTAKAIARILSTNEGEPISHRTVEVHLGHIYEKIQSKSILDLIKVLQADGITLPPSTH